jgi:hypothetical protein
VYPPGEEGVVLVSNVAQPDKVLVDGLSIDTRDEVESGSQPVWRYDKANAYLAIRVAHDGQSSIEIRGAEFRSVCRLGSGQE